MGAKVCVRLGSHFFQIIARSIARDIRAIAIACLLSCSLGLPNCFASPGGIKARVVITSDLHFDSKWNDTNPYYRPAIHRVHKVCKGERVYVRSFITGAKADSYGSYYVTCDVHMVDPKGNPFYTKKNRLVWRENNVGGKNVILSRVRVKLIFDPPDPLGDYTVILNFHDHISNERFRIAQMLSLIPYDSDSKMMTREQLERFMTYYYQHPDSHRIMAALETATRINMPSARNSLAPAFAALFADNAYLLPYLAGRIKNLSEQARRLLSGQSGPNLKDGKIISAEELDMLWAVFFVTGEVEPLREIVAGVALGEDADPRRKALGKAALESLKKNSKQHELVSAYLDHMISWDGSLGEYTRKALQQCLREASPKVPSLSSSTPKYEQPLADRFVQASVAAYDYGLGKISQWMFRTSAAMNHFNEAASLYRCLGNQRELAKCFLAMASISESNEDLPQAIRALEEAAACFRATHDDRALVHALEALDELYSARGEYGEAERCAIETIPILARKENEPLTFAYAKLHLVQIREMSGDDLARNEELLESARKVFQASGMMRSVAECDKILGDYHLDKKEYGQAKVLYRRSLKIVEQRRSLNNVIDQGSDVHAQATLNFNLGSAHIYSDKYEEAIAYFKKARHQFLSLGSVGGVGICSDGLGMAYLAKGRYKEAESQLKEAEKIAQQLGDMDLSAESQRNLAKLYRKIGQPAKARWYYRKAYKIFTRIGQQGKARYVLEQLEHLRQEARVSPRVDRK